MKFEPISIALRVIDVLELMKIPYFIGGSIASSILGEPRSTNDIDIVVAMTEGHVTKFHSLLKDAFYVEESTIREAIRRTSSFNMIEETTIQKIDIFILGEDDYSAKQLQRRTTMVIDPSSGRQVFISSAEDTILNKLKWYRKTGETSDRQWKDILGVVKVQKDRLDIKYLKSWSIKLGVSKLLEKTGL